MEFNAFVCGLCLADMLADIKYKKTSWATGVIALFAGWNGAVWLLLP